MMTARLTNKPLACAALWLCTTPAFAHGGARGLVMLLPTGYYQVAAALAVAATFALLLCAPMRRLRRLESRSAPLLRLRARPAKLPSWLSFGVFCALLSAAHVGSPDPLANPLPLFVWTLWWVGFTGLQCALGDLWPLLNPWSGPLAVIRRFIPRAPLRPPRALGYAPAVALFFIFAWFELVDPAPDNPVRLAHAALGYWCFTFAACLLFGERYWLRYAEPFAVFFRLIGHCSPLCRQASADGKLNIRLCLPGAQYISRPPLPLSGVCFVLLTLSAVSFDGLNKTFTWLGWLGVNPLLFPGRSALINANTVGLLLAFVALASAFFACVWLGCRAAGCPADFTRACGCLAYSLIPISLVFHFAHYLTALLTNSQYALLAFNDPFARGWNLLGAAGYLVTTPFLTHLPSASLIWSAQTALIVCGHITGIAAAHLTAARLFPTARATAASQWPLAALMVLYTLFGLWLLSTPAVG